MLSKIKTWCRHSWTVAWGYLKALVGALIAAAPFLSDKLNDPQIQNALPPAWVGYGLMAIAAITIAARVLPHLGEKNVAP